MYQYQINLNDTKLTKSDIGTEKYEKMMEIEQVKVSSSKTIHQRILQKNIRVFILHNQLRDKKESFDKSP